MWKNMHSSAPRPKNSHWVEVIHQGLRTLQHLRTNMKVNQNSSLPRMQELIRSEATRVHSMKDLPKDTEKITGNQIHDRHKLFSEIMRARDSFKLHTMQISLELQLQPASVPMVKAALERLSKMINEAALARGSFFQFPEMPPLLKMDPPRSKQAARKLQQHIITTFPVGMTDTLRLYGGWRVEVWLQGQQLLARAKQAKKVEQARVHSGGSERGCVAVIMGSQSISVRPFLDALHCLFVRDEVVIMKHHRLSSHQHKFFLQIFRVAIGHGWCESVAAGDREFSQKLGAALAVDEKVGHLVVTGKAKHFKEIIFGDGSEGKKRLEMGHPVIGVDWEKSGGELSRVPEQTSAQLSFEHGGKIVSARLDSLSPWIIVPCMYTAAELSHQVKALAKALQAQGGATGTFPQAVIVSKQWPQHHDFFTLLHQEMHNYPVRPYPDAQYPNTRNNYFKIRKHYQDAGVPVVDMPNKGTQCRDHWHPDLDHSMQGETAFLPWFYVKLLHCPGSHGGRSIIGQDPSEHSLLNCPSRAPCFAVVEIDQGGGPKPFLDAAVHLCNHGVRGTLSCTIIAHPSVNTQHHGRQSPLEVAVEDLRFGNISINCWSGLCAAIPEATWGPFPDEDYRFPVSGRGHWQNASIIDKPQKSVVWSPLVHDFHLWPPGDMTIAQAEKVVHYNVRPNIVSAAAVAIPNDHFSFSRGVLHSGQGTWSIFQWC